MTDDTEQTVATPAAEASPVTPPTVEATTEPQTAPAPVPPVDTAPTTAEAEVVLEHDAERKVRKGFWELLDEAKSDASKGLVWLEAELKKLCEV